MTYRIPFIFLLVLAPLAPAAPRVLEQLDLAPVWAGHPVGFSLLTSKDTQYVAYYDKDRRMTLASRPLSSKQWTLFPLHTEQETPGKWSPAQLLWDSHNNVTIALDSAGHLHIAGNMHVHPLVYFKTEKPGDITSVKFVGKMTGQRENRCTYPRFLNGPKGELIFAYRDGSSGNGSDVYNVYDVSSSSWKRLLDTPLTDGEGKRNAYCRGPVKGPDGFYHLVWVWRDTPDCSTNHNLSYARSKDLIHWETSAARPLALPMTLTNSEIVDPVPAKGGIINGNTHIGFDREGRIVLSYHKYDAAGNTQIYNARRLADRWQIVPASNWTTRWEFSGGGTIGFELRMSNVTPVEGGLGQTWSSKSWGRGSWLLDDATLAPIGKYQPPATIPPELSKLQSTFEGMLVHLTEDLGQSPTANERYLLRWETLGANRDRPRPGPLPEPSMLRVYRIGN